MHIVSTTAGAVMRLRPTDPMQLVDDICADRIDAGELSLHEELAIRRWCRATTRASEARIQSYIDHGRFRAARRERDAHMCKRAVLLHACLVTVRKAFRIDQPTQLQREEARQKRLRLAFRKVAKVGRFRCSARGWQRLRPKRNGGARPITTFHLVDQARQYVLKSALTPFASFHDAQFMLARDAARRGPAAVRKSLLTALDQCGEDSVFMQFDVVDFYGSIAHRWLEESLHMDPAITMRQIHLGGMIIEPCGDNVFVHATHEANKRGGRWGIPQGSRLSSLIAEHVMAEVLRSAAVFSDLPSFVWSDNLGAIVPKVRAREVERLVREAFGAHEAGPFTLTVTSRPVTAEFKFLGAWYRKLPGKSVAFIPDEIVSTWEASIIDRLLTCSEVDLPKIENHVRGKLAQWAWCPRAREAHDYLNDIVQSLWASFSRSPLPSELTH